MRILFWSISLLVIVGWAAGRVFHPGNGDFPHHIFIIRHALDFVFLNAAILFFIVPFLHDKKIIGKNYYKEDELGKAKMFLVFYTIALPGLLLVFFASWCTGVGKVPYTLIMLLFCYGYIKNCLIYFKKETKISWRKDLE